VSPDEERRQILAVIDTYVRAIGDADVDLLESLFWTDDPQFCEVENDQPMPFGKERFFEIAHWVREHGRPGDNQQRFRDTEVYMLAPDVAYTVSLRDELNANRTSRVTLIFMRKNAEWRIVHGHFSYVPE
jgi:ketosteroid isomerase-like protein